VDLFREIGVRVGYSFSTDHLKRQVYYPKHFGDIEADNLRLRTNLANALTGDGLKIQLVSNPKEEGKIKPRHTAALALVGWYLMVPPLSADGTRIVENLPLSKWDAVLPFDNAEHRSNTAKAIIDDITKKAYDAKLQYGGHITLSKEVALFACHSRLFFDKSETDHRKLPTAKQGTVNEVQSAAISRVDIRRRQRFGDLPMSDPVLDYFRFIARSCDAD
jgi:hypothetical protein